MNTLKHKIDKDFTVVSNVLLKSKLSAKSKGIFLQIISLPEGWEFSIRGLSALFTDKETSIKTGIDELVEAGFITWENHKDKNGRFSVTVTTQYPKSPYGKNPCGKIPHGENPNNKELKNKGGNNKDLNNNSTNVELAKAGTSLAIETYGNEDINKMLALWESTIGYKITSNQKKNRFAISNLLKKYGYDGLKGILGVVKVMNGDKYAPSIADFCSIQSKQNEIQLWVSKKRATVESKVINLDGGLS